MIPLFLVCTIDMTRPFFAIVGFDRDVIDRIHGSNYLVLLIEHKSNLTPESLSYSDYLITFKYDEIDSLTENITTFLKNYTIIGAVSTHDFGIKLASMVNELVGSECNSLFTISCTRDKLAMRQQLGNLNSIPYAPLTDNDSIILFGRENGWPVILKPRDGLGSHSVFIIYDETTAKQFIIFSDMFIIEKFVNGRLLSVDCISVSGSHYLVSVTEQFLIGRNNIFANEFVKIGHNVPAEIEHFIEDEIGKNVIMLLDKLGVQTGPTHTEIILDSNNNINFIETHCRPAGNDIIHLINFTTGIDIFSMFLELFLCNSNVKIALNKKTTYKFRSSRRYFAFSPGIVKSICGIDAVRYSPNIIDIDIPLAVGDKINILMSSQDRYGSISTFGNTTAEATYAIEKYMKKIKLDISAGFSLKL